MAVEERIIKIDDSNYLIITDTKGESRLFFPSKNINIFPCSRRGQYDDNDTPKFYDPEARLNTERTNRIGNAINGFTDSYIVPKDTEDSSNTLIFVLAGYHVEIKNLGSVDAINDFGAKLEAAGISLGYSTYAHLSLHKGISLNIEGYTTEILYRQSTKESQKNYLDVTYSYTDAISGESVSDSFFVGISFTAEAIKDIDTVSGAELKEYNLLLSEKVNGSWQFVQTSILPKIEHGETEDSIKVNGDLVADSIETPLLNIIDEGKISTPTVETTKITSNSTEIVVDKVLKVDTINSDSTNGLTIEQAAKLEKTLTVEKATTVNDTITAEKLVVTRVVDEIDETTGETTRVDKGEVVTPTLRVNRLTTNSGSITVDDKNLVVTKSLEVLAAKAIDEEDRGTAATATIDKAVIGQLEVKADPTKLVGSTGKIETDGQLTVGQYINVGSPMIPTATTGDVVAKNSIFAENNIVAKNTLKAPTIYQTVSGSDKPVPFIDIVEQANGQWQLQISRASTIAKQN